MREREETERREKGEEDRGMPNREVLEGQPVGARFLGSHPLVTKPCKSMNEGWGGDGCGAHSQKKGIGERKRERKETTHPSPPHIP